MITSSEITINIAGTKPAQGMVYLPSLPIFVSHLITVWNFKAGMTVKSMLVRLSGDDIAEILFDGPVFATPAAVDGMLLQALPQSAALQPGVEYAIVAVRTDGTDVSPINIKGGELTILNFPGYPLKTTINWAKKDPLVGDTGNRTVTADIRYCHMIYTL